MVKIELSGYNIARRSFTSYYYYTTIDRLIWLMVSAWLVIDSITGFFISYGADMPLSQLFKLSILMLILVRLQHKGIMLLLVTLIYLSGYLLHIILIDGDFVKPVLRFFKFLSLVYLYLYFRFSFRYFPQKTIRNAQKALLIAWIVFACNVVLGLMGYGVSTYGEEEEIDMGVKGFFYSGNELGGIMAVLAPFMFYWILVRLSGLKYVIAYVAVIVIGVLVGTKTSILVTVLSAVIVPLLYLSPRKRVKLLVALAIIIGLTVPYVINIIADSSIGVIERWDYVYNKGGLTQLIYSGRDDYWNMQGRLFFNSDFLTQLFGMGGFEKSIERDHLDSILMFGYLGLMLIVLFFLYLLIRSFRHRHNNTLMKIVIFSNLLILGIGYMAGHVWFSAMASVYIALLNGFSYLRVNGILFSKSNHISEENA